MTQIHVAILDQLHPAIAATIRDGLPPGWVARFAASREPADQAAALAGAALAFVIAAPLRRELIERAQHLRFVQKLGAGVDRIDLEACAERGIAVARLAGGNAIPVAEHTVMMMLACLRRLPLVDRRTRAGDWLKEDARGVHRQLHGKRVGLVGLGAIGKAVAGALSGFGVEIVYYDPLPCPPEVAGALAVSEMALEALLASADIVSLHLPLTAATKGLIDARRLALMKPSAVLINCARGGLVDEAALAEALDEGRLLAAGIDCFAEEPPVGSPLLASERSVVTSHLAGATLDNFQAVFERGLANAIGYLAGEALPESDAVLAPARPPTSAKDRKER